MSLHPITQAIRIQTERTNEMEHSTPMFLTSSFCYDDAEEMRATFADETDFNIYSRFSNPNVKDSPIRFAPSKVPKRAMPLLPA